MDILKKAHHIHFIGIGGIGISAIARMMLVEGRQVTGSDTHHSKTTHELEQSGVHITFDQAVSTIPKAAEVIIYSAAIPLADKDFFKAMKALAIPSMTYPEALAFISKEKFTIAVSGTHGKTTTTAMIAKIMIDAGLDPTVIIGSVLLDHNSNFIAGKSRYLVVEADEYQRGFLNLSPNILVITNIAVDHLDYYKDLKEIQETFDILISRVMPGGHVLRPTDWSKTDPPKSLSMPGKHNRENAQAALSVAEILGIPRTRAEESLKNFKGTWRRFEYKGMTKEGALVYDDYAHNPDKVRAALQGAREKFSDKKIIAVFQPHLYSRTKFLLKEFAECFTDADRVVLLPIYGAREAFDPSITSDMLAQEIQKNLTNVRLCGDFDSAENYLHSEINFDCVIIVIGAGSITDLATRLVKDI